LLGTPPVGGFIEPGKPPYRRGGRPCASAGGGAVHFRTDLDSDRLLQNADLDVHRRVPDVKEAIGHEFVHEKQKVVEPVGRKGEVSQAHRAARRTGNVADSGEPDDRPFLQALWWHWSSWVDVFKLLFGVPPRNARDDLEPE
jgi:hypothetical protein